MQNNNLNLKMPILNTFKTTAAVGLLMQQVVSMHCIATPVVYRASTPYRVTVGESVRSTKERGQEAINFLKDLTKTLENGYSVLSAASYEQLDGLLSGLEASKLSLVETQLKGLDGAVREIYVSCAEDKKQKLLPILLVVARARMAATQLSGLVSQMTKTVTEFQSSINMEALSALAIHGARALNSDSFH